MGATSSAPSRRVLSNPLGFTKRGKCPGARGAHARDFHSRHLRNVTGMAAFSLQDKFPQLLDKGILLPAASPFPFACKSLSVPVLCLAADKPLAFPSRVIPHFCSSPCTAHPAQLYPFISHPETSSRAGMKSSFSTGCCTDCAQKTGFEEQELPCRL